MIMRPRDFTVEFRSNLALRRGIQRAIEGGDKEAQAAFTSGHGVLKGMTGQGVAVRSDEIADYIRRVVAADGDNERTAWLYDLD